MLKLNYWIIYSVIYGYIYSQTFDNYLYYISRLIGLGLSQLGIHGYRVSDNLKELKLGGGYLAYA